MIRPYVFCPFHVASVSATFFSLVRHVSQLGETCLTFYSLVRHVSHLFQFLAQTLVSCS